MSETPGHTVQIFGREDGPDEQMAPQDRASQHDKQQMARGEVGQRCHVPDRIDSRRTLKQKQTGSRRPPERTSPVPDVGEEADGANVVAIDAVVRTGQIHRRDRI